MDWSSLQHAYGPADDVPGLLAALSDPACRDDARYWLRAALCHQRTRYPASAAVVPVLLALALQDTFADRAWVLDFVADLAVGDADRWLLEGDPGPPDDRVEQDVLAAVDANVPALRTLLADPDPAIRARAGRVLHLRGHELPDDDDPVVRAGVAMAAREPARFLGDPDGWVAAAAAFRTADLPTAARLAAALPSPTTSPWLAGDATRLIVATLASAGPGAAEALSTLARSADLRTARSALPPALRAASSRLPPRGGYPGFGAAPAALQVLAALVGDTPALGTPAVWEAMSRAGLPGDPALLARFLGRAAPRSPLDALGPRGATWRTLGQALGGGAGGPTLIRELEGATLTTTLGSARRRRDDRADALRGLGALGADAVAVLLALAEEAEAGFEGLAPALDPVVGAAPAQVLAAVVALAHTRVRPVERWEPRGHVVLHSGQVLLLALGTRAATALGRPPDPALDPLTEGALAAEVFAGPLVAWLDAVGPERSRVWGLHVLARRPHDLRGATLARVLDTLDDRALADALSALDPGFAVAALPPRRIPAVGPALLARLETFLAGRARWMRRTQSGDGRSLTEEVERLASSLREKGPAAGRALRRLPAGPFAARVLDPVGPPPPAPPAPNADLEGAAAALASAVVELVLTEPLFGWLVGRLERGFTDATPTMGLVLRPGRRIGLLVNPTWFLGQSARTRVGALRHEVLHLLFGHPFRTDLGPVDLATYGTAADLVVNEHPGRWPLPADARRHPWGSPPIPASSTLDAGYRLLLAQKFAGNTTGPEVWHSDHRHWRAEPGGHPLVPGDVVDAGVGFDGLVGEGVGALGGDALWGLEPGVRSLVLGAVERHRSALDWRRVLRGFAASSRRTEVVHTLARRSRRYGTFPGIRVCRRHRLAVAIDTSGSVSADTLRRLFREVAAIHRGGSEVVVVECDARVQRAWVFTGAPPEEVHGRGGTAFEPVMVWLHGPDLGRFDGLVYLTDGQGPAPETRPPCPMLWVLTPEGTAGPHLRFGGSVKIPSEV